MTRERKGDEHKKEPMEERAPFSLSNATFSLQKILLALFFFLLGFNPSLALLFVMHHHGHVRAASPRQYTKRPDFLGLHIDRANRCMTSNDAIIH